MQEPIQEPVEQRAETPIPDSGPVPLRRDMARRMLGGVCAGIARTYDYDITVVRVVALLLALPGGFGLVLYAALWALMPADTGTPQPSSTSPVSNAEELAERIRLAADEFAAATRAAAYATRVAAEQLSEVARAASAAGRESWETRPSAQAAAAPPAAPVAADAAPASPLEATATTPPSAPAAGETPPTAPPA